MRTFSFHSPSRLVFNTAFLILFIVLPFILLGIQVFQVKAMALENYKIQAHQEELGKMIDENEVLETNFAETRSLENLESLVKNLNFENIDEIHYIRVLESPVASK